MDFLFYTDSIGIIAFTIAGFLFGYHKKLDILGILILSSLTALGGGITRDIILNKAPDSFVNSYNFSLVLIIFIIILIFKLYKLDLNNKKLFLIFDSIGLVSFAIGGGLTAISADFNIFGIIWLAFITAVGGGVLRDLFINYTPLILKEGFYGSVTIIAGIILYLINKFYIINIYSIILIFSCLLTLRLVAYFKNWNLTKLK